MIEDDREEVSTTREKEKERGARAGMTTTGRQGEIVTEKGREAKREGETQP